jgi:hypothetical protein
LLPEGRIRITPPRRFASSPARTCRRRWPSSSGRSKRAHRDYATAERAAVDAGARERAKAGAAASPDVDDDQAVDAGETAVSEDMDPEENLEAGLDA